MKPGRPGPAAPILALVGACLAAFLASSPTGAESLADPLDLVLAEIAWAGTTGGPNDEWMVLHNNAEADLDLTAWRLLAADGTPDVALAGVVPAGGHFLLERTDDSSAAPSADLIYRGALANEGELLRILDAEGSEVDVAGRQGAWFAGDNTLKRTMERWRLDGAGSQPASWRMGPIDGNPRNSIQDRDGDGFGFSPNLDWVERPGAPGLEARDEDCDDAEAETYPGAPERLDLADNDCDGEVDEGHALGPLDYSLYFSDEEALRRSGPSPQMSRMEGALLEAIDGAQSSIDAALYDLDRERMRDALLAAHARGVRVRVVADSDHAQSDPNGATPHYEALRAAGIPLRISNFAGYLQHNKFAVFDGARVWTGSANWTHTDLTYNLNNALLLRAPHLALAYGREFAEMFEAGRFATRKLDDTPHVFAYDDATVEIRFSPSDGVEDRVADALSMAEQSVGFAMFFWTSERLGKLLATRAMTDGLRVVGVWDALGAANPSSQDERLCAAGIPLRIENFGGKVHHKFAVLDPDGANPVSITGSYNWTSAGDEKNDENTLIIRDHRAIAAAYQAEIDRLIAALPDRTICRRSSAESGLPACSDGIDNDFDDLIDLADPGCRESTVATCLDRIDNDADGFIDQADLDCHLAPTPTPASSPSPTRAGIPDPAETATAPRARLFLPLAWR